jgi:hypothetical protein
VTRARTLATAAAALVLAAAAGASPHWLAPARLSTGDIALGPEPALGAAGDALVVWDHEVGEICPEQPANPACVHVVEAVTRPPGARTWSAPVEIARPGVDSRPVAAVDAGGGAVALWVHDIGEDRVLQASYRRGRTGAWPEPTDLSEVTRRIGAHAVAFDAEGDATVAWAGTDAFGATVVLAKERPATSGVWGGPIVLSGNAAGGPSLAVNGAGDAVVVWTRAGTGVVQASVRPAASGLWSTPADLSAPGAGPDPHVALDAAGDAVAVWTRGAVESAFRTAGGAWAAPVAVSSPLPRRGDPRVALDAAGNAVAVWLALDGIESAGRPRETGAWSAPAAVAPATTPPQLALDAAGNAVAAWTDARGTTQAALRPASSGRWLPPTEVSGPVTAAVRVVGGSFVVWNRIEPRGAAVESADLDAAGPLIESASVPAAGTAGVRVAFAVTPVPWIAPLAGLPQWSFGDGASAAGARVAHVYAAPGRYRVTVTQVDVAGGTATESAAVEITASTPRNIARPSVRGQARVGATLTCARGSWAGTPPIRFAFRWLRARAAIRGATAQRYRVRAADTGALVACRVTAANAAGARTSASRPIRIGKH